MKQSLPAGYRFMAVPGGQLIARDGIALWLSQQIAQHGTLEAYARQAPDSRPMRGRGPAYLVSLPNQGTGLVRWLRHGGLLARFTGDRFLPAGRPRPFNELLTAAHLKERGIETPVVLAACVYPSLAWYRGEVLRTYHAECTDLASYLFDSGPSDDQRLEAVAAAVHLAGRLAEAGVLHRDFNAMNVLVHVADAGADAWVIDLEKSAACRPPGARARRRMLRRLAGSLAKVESGAPRALPVKVWEPLRAGSGRA